MLQFEPMPACKHPTIASGATPIGSAGRAPGRKSNKKLQNNSRVGCYAPPFRVLTQRSLFPRLREINSIPRSPPWWQHIWMLRLRRKGKTRRSALPAWHRPRRRSVSYYPYLRMMKNPDGRVGYPYILARIRLSKASAA